MSVGYGLSNGSFGRLDVPKTDIRAHHDLKI
jgi:hypothetical protein